MDNAMIDKLKSMLDDPSAMATLSAIANTLGSQRSGGGSLSSDKEKAEQAPSLEGAAVETAEYGANQDAAVSRIREIISNASRDSDPRINLLNSLKPYMRSSRSSKMEQAIQLIQIAKIASVFKKPE